jgi:N-methylhydantoinase A
MIMPSSPGFSRYIGIDTGGTFTDLVEIDSHGQLTFDKAFSTPLVPEQAIIDVLERMAEFHRTTVPALLKETVRFAHGTTVSTNALIQRKGARVGLLTTRGFEDTLQIARGPIGRSGGIPQSKAMDFLHTNPPPPLVPRSRIRGLGERVAVTGEVIAPLREKEVEAALKDLIEGGVESLAVCLLWSFRNPAHEQLVREVAGKIVPHVPVSLSSEIAPRTGEFERTVTTVVNAFIGPVTERYIGNLQNRLSDLGLAHPVQVMKSSGGLMLPDAVAHQAVSIVNSGPIGGLVAARHIGQLFGYDRVITADMGGTSFDVGLISGGVFEEQNSPFLDQGLPVCVPSLKIVTIGAGGGSIAASDGFRLQVGPQSAGAHPGPACYERGGEEPTVTDALVLLGIIDPENFFGGRYVLNPERARSAIERRVAKPLGLSAVEAAAGIYEVVTARMGDLIRKVTVESGYDPRRFCLLAYGGASGAHCTAFAAQLGVGRVIIPYAAPVFSGLGIALSDIVYSHGKSEPVPLIDTAQTIETVNRTFAELEKRARADMLTSGIRDPAEIVMNYKIDMRYQGQMNEVSLPWGTGMFTAEQIPLLRDAFETHYQQKFGAGTIRRETPLELISFRAEAVKLTEKPPLIRVFKEADGRGELVPVKHRSIYQHGQGWVKTGIFDFERLRPGDKLVGPVVAERQNTTIWLPAGAVAVFDGYGNLEIDPGGQP